MGPPKPLFTAWISHIPAVFGRRLKGARPYRASPGFPGAAMVPRPADPRRVPRPETCRNPDGIRVAPGSAGSRLSATSMEPWRFFFLKKSPLHLFWVFCVFFVSGKGMFFSISCYFMVKGLDGLSLFHPQFQGASLLMVSLHRGRTIPVPNHTPKWQFSKESKPSSVA